MLKFIAAFPIQPDGRIVNILQQFWICRITRRDEVSPTLCHPILFPRQIEVILPRGQRGQDHRAHPLHSAKTLRGAAQDFARIATHCLEQPVQRNGANIRQRVHHEESLPLGEIVAHADKLQEGFCAAILKRPALNGVMENSAATAVASSLPQHRPQKVEQFRGLHRNLASQSGERIRRHPVPHDPLDRRQPQGFGTLRD
jgi:hypothetical protein